ncbi:MAG: site-specific integrase [Planctomycetes bacterium]|nr:site-specific integrase [Planctomycetota bacterium]
MPRPRNPIPKVRCHKGAAVIDMYDAGKRRTITLGPWGSRDADLELARILNEHKATDTSRSRITVNEVLLAFIQHAEKHYVRADGSTTHEVSEYKLVVRYVRELYGHKNAADFGPLALKAVRQKFIEVGWCRSLINQRVNRIRRMFRFAVAEEMIPATALTALAAVSGLQRGRSQVREKDPVLPIADEVVDATLPYLTRHVRGLIELQRLTGCRPGEACTIRRADIETDGDVWLYRPIQHKNIHRGKDRIVAIGPRAQVLLREFFTPDPADFLFSPRRAVEEVLAQRSMSRKTPRYPSHMKRNALCRVGEPQRTPTKVYDATSYGHAIAKACTRTGPTIGQPIKLLPRRSAHYSFTSKDQFVVYQVNSTIFALPLEKPTGMPFEIARFEFSPWEVHVLNDDLTLLVQEGVAEDPDVKSSADPMRIWWVDKGNKKNSCEARKKTSIWRRLQARQIFASLQ